MSLAVALQPAQIEALLDAARAVYGEFKIGYDVSAGSCAAAILAANGKIYTGICLDLHCGIGFCAEHAAVAEMLKARETRVLAAVAVAVGGHDIAPPCGRCRELIAQIDPANLDTWFILEPGVVKPLRELLPVHWQAERWHKIVPAG